MPRFIIITDTTTELFDGKFSDLQHRLKVLTETTGKVPIWSQTGPTSKPKFYRRNGRK